MKQHKPESPPQNDGIAATVEPVTVSPGLYMFSVRSGSPEGKPGRHGLQLPALNVTVGPGTSQQQVEFVPSHTANGTWLSKVGDLLVVKVNPPGATLLMNSVRTTSGSALAVRFEKLEDRGAQKDAPAAAAAPAAVRVDPAPPLPAEPIVEDKAADGLKLKIGTHVRARGDLDFVDKLWAGKIGKGHWIESFSVTPLEALTAPDVEYKGLTSSGFESPWITNGASCGTRGMGIPLIGFAVRLETDAARKDYDCEYSAYCQSGIVVGPLRNGVPCRSTVANDPIEGLQIRIVKRSPASMSLQTPARPQPATPRFGRYRSDDEAAALPAKPGKTQARTAVKKPAAKKPARKIVKATPAKGRR